MPMNQWGQWYDEEEQAASPRIMNNDYQGGYTQDTSAPVDQASFRPFEQGGTHGTIDNPATFEQTNAARAAHFQRQAIEQLPLEQQLQARGQLVQQQQQQARVQAGLPAEMSPEENLMRTQAEISRRTPSHAESINQQRLQNSLAAIQSQMATGTISMQAGQQAMQMINQQLQPLLVRQSEVPMYRARAQYQQLQMQTAQRAALMQASAHHHAQGLQGNYRDVQLAGGGVAHAIVDRNGDAQFIPANALPQAQAGREAASQARTTQQAQTRYDSAFTAARREVAAEMSSFNRAADDAARERLRPSWFIPTSTGSPGQTRVHSREEIMETEASRRATQRTGGPNPSSQQGQGNAQGGAAQQGQPAQQEQPAPPAPVTPRPIAPNAPLDQLPRDQQATLTEMSAARERIAQNQSLTTEQHQAAAILMRNAEELYRQHGSLQAMPAPARENFLTIMERLDGMVATRQQRQSQIREANAPQGRTREMPPEDVAVQTATDALRTEAAQRPRPSPGRIQELQRRLWAAQDAQRTSRARGS